MFSPVKPPPSPFEPPSIPYRILSSPLKFVAQLLYSFTLWLRGTAVPVPSSTSAIRIICISDTHTHKPTNLPAGDVLVHAGDLSNAGTVAEIQDQVDWLSSLPYEHKIVIGGNHDSFFDPRSRQKEDLGKHIEWRDVQYLQHSSVKLRFPNKENRQLCFFGAPQIPQCGPDSFAFQYRRTDDAWSGTIPSDTDVLITHTPPRFHLDLPRGMGCEFLLREVWRVKPTLCIYGHVHAGWGRESVFWDETQRLYEKVCARSEVGMLQDALAIRSWIELVKLVWYGLLGILWNRVWGGDDNGTIMINSAMMYRSSGKLRNPPQTVVI